MEIEDSPNDPPSLTGSIEGTKLDNVGLDRMELEAGTDAASMGDQTYDLYAVLVHRGSHIGGHYYAYIKVKSSSSHIAMTPPSRLLRIIGCSLTIPP